MIDSRPIAEAIGACRRHLMAVAGFSAMLNLLYIAPTLYMLQVYSRVVPTHSRATLLFLTLAMLLALATLASLDGLRGRLLVRAGVRLDRQLAPLILSAALEPGAGQSARQVIREFDALRQVLSGPAVLAMVDKMSLMPSPASGGRSDNELVRKHVDDVDYQWSDGALLAAAEKALYSVANVIDWYRLNPVYYL